MTFDEEIHKLQQELENKFRDVRDHVIVSVRNYSMWIAFLLMGVTSLILVIGTLIVWYRHRHSNQTEREEDESKGHGTRVISKEKVKSNVSENNNHVNNGTVKVSGNDSPVKSRIPVRTKVKQS